MLDVIHVDNSDMCCLSLEGDAVASSLCRGVCVDDGWRKEGINDGQAVGAVHDASVLWEQLVMYKCSRAG